MRFGQQSLSRLASRLAVCAAAAGLAMSAAVPAQSAPSAPGVPSAPRLADVEIVQTTETVGDYQQVRAFCPDRKVVISGGAEAKADGSHTESLAVVSSHPEFFPWQEESTLWVASARNFYGQPSTVTAWAVCATRPSGYEVVQTPLSQVPVDQPVTASCPAGKVALGGGGDIQGDRSALNKSYPAAFDSSVQPSQWVVAGRKGENTTVGVVATVTCADPIPDVTWATGKVTSNSPVGGFLACKDGRQVVSGGASANGRETVLTASRPGLQSEGAVSDGWWAQAGSFYEPFEARVYVMCTSR